MNDYRATGAARSLYILYARADDSLCEELRRHLSVLVFTGEFSIWDGQGVAPGEDWQYLDAQQIEVADIVLVLLSADFFTSSYHYKTVLPKLLDRQRAGSCLLFPVVLRSIDLGGTVFEHLQMLPRDGRPIVLWENRDQAWITVVHAIRSAISASRQEPPAASQAQPQSRYHLHDVFRKSGVPTVTFVPHQDFVNIMLALADPGRGVIIEGPSGVGKTTAVQRAAELITEDGGGPAPKLRFLSARRVDDVAELKEIQRWHDCTVVVDDFHRLDDSVATIVTDHLKHLADSATGNTKLVVVGIPRTGETLVRLSFDVATRIDVFRLTRVEDNVVHKMIQLGEAALNIAFEGRSDIILAAGGSLNIAQYLCYQLCALAGVSRTQNRRTTVFCDLETAMAQAQSDVARKFSEPVQCLAAFGGRRSRVTLRLIEELAKSPDGSVALKELSRTAPELSQELHLLVDGTWVQSIARDCAEFHNFFFFDSRAQMFVADDPQLMFYLRRISIAQLARAVGKSAVSEKTTVFISYSPADAPWLARLQKHLSPIIRAGLVDLWDDTRIQPGMRWREEIERAIDGAAVAIVLVSADLLASPFVLDYELPQFLRRAQDGGTVILPIIVSHCLFLDTELSVFEPVNDPAKPLAALRAADRDAVFLKVAKAIHKMSSGPAKDQVQ